MNRITCILSNMVIIVFLTIIFIESKKMNNQQKEQSSCFQAQDNNGRNILIEWHITNMMSADFAHFMKSVWSFARDAYMPVEMDFLKAFPEIVGQEPYFAPFEPLFMNKEFSEIDWSAAKKTMETLLKGHFVFDPAQFPKQVIEMFGKDRVICVMAKEQSTGATIGFITFLMRQDYQSGDIKVMSFAVDVNHQKRGLGKILMSSIFKIIPTITRIFLCTRVTNVAALHAYRRWGFVIDHNPIMDHAFNPDHWTFMEYKVDQSNILQKTAEKLIE